MGIQLPSLNGGMGANYGSTGTGYADGFGMVKTALNMNKAYQDWCNDDAYSLFMEFVNVSAQFDSENNMPEADAKVNVRSSKTEKRGTNGVHPNTDGYYQIGDVVYRCIVANYCQS
jgi:lysophospholipase L1-like esterase